MSDRIANSLRYELETQSNNQALYDVIQGKKMASMVTQLGTKELQALYNAHRIRFMLMDKHNDTYDAIIFRHIGGETEAKKLAKEY